MTEAEAGVADREFRQITADNFYHAAQDGTREPRVRPEAHADVALRDRTPPTGPRTTSRPALDPEAPTQRALVRRPELTIARQQVEQSEIALKFASERAAAPGRCRGQLRHARPAWQSTRTAASASWIAGTPPRAELLSPTQPVGTPTKYSDTTDDWFKGNNNRVWTAGAVVSIPDPQHHGARQREHQRASAAQGANTNVKRVEQDIVKDVRNAVRNLESALQGVEAAERNVAASTEQCLPRRSASGSSTAKSTPFDVLQREESLVTPRASTTPVLRVYHGSVTALDRAPGHAARRSQHRASKTRCAGCGRISRFFEPPRVSLFGKKRRSRRRLAPMAREPVGHPDACGSRVDSSPAPRARTLEQEMTWRTSASRSRSRVISPATKTSQIEGTVEGRVDLPEQPADDRRERPREAPRCTRRRSIVIGRVDRQRDRLRSASEIQATGIVDGDVTAPRPVIAPEGADAERRRSR